MNYVGIKLALNMFHPCFVVSASGEIFDAFQVHTAAYGDGGR